MDIYRQDQLARAIERVAECVALSEICTRVDHCNEEDFAMLQKVANVNFNLLVKVGDDLKSVKEGI